MHNWNILWRPRNKSHKLGKTTTDNNEEYYNTCSSGSIITLVREFGYPQCRILKNVAKTCCVGIVIIKYFTTTK